HGFGVFIPLSEHQPYDLIAVRDDGAFSRVQVKYRKLSAEGTVIVNFRSTYSDSNGYHHKPVDRSQFDCYAVYCPDNRKIYYVLNSEIPGLNTGCFSLRVLPPKNNQRRKVLMASQFESRERIFSNTPP
ncbi:MAG: group I intron-associated PD-(D/E)XK endonuclease, partial [Candidatus Geothermincolia bacterium]